MTIYISLPISGYDLSERRRVAEAARLHLQAENPEARVVSPFDLADYVEALNPQARYSDYMKEDLAFILDEADVVCFLENPLFTKSRGVRLEYAAARAYGKRIERMSVRRVRP